MGSSYHDAITGDITQAGPITGVTGSRTRSAPRTPRTLPPARTPVAASAAPPWQTPPGLRCTGLRQGCLPMALPRHRPKSPRGMGTDLPFPLNSEAPPRLQLSASPVRLRPPPWPPQRPGRPCKREARGAQAAAMLPGEEQAEQRQYGDNHG